jgi:hypothetical protein
MNQDGVAAISLSYQSSLECDNIPLSLIATRRTTMADAHESFWEVCEDTGEWIIHNLAKHGSAEGKIGVATGLITTGIHMIRVAEHAASGEWKEAADSSMDMANSALNTATDGAYGMAKAIVLDMAAAAYEEAGLGKAETVKEIEKHLAETIGDHLGDWVFELNQAWENDEGAPSAPPDLGEPGGDFPDSPLDEPGIDENNYPAEEDGLDFDLDRPMADEPNGDSGISLPVDESIGIEIEPTDDGGMCLPGDGGMSLPGDGGVSLPGDGSMSSPGDGSGTMPPPDAGSNPGGISSPGDGGMSLPGDGGGAILPPDTATVPDGGGMSLPGDSGGANPSPDGPWQAPANDGGGGPGVGVLLPTAADNAQNIQYAPPDAGSGVLAPSESIGATPPDQTPPPHDDHQLPDPGG